MLPSRMPASLPALIFHLLYFWRHNGLTSLGYRPGSPPPKPNRFGWCHRRPLPPSAEVHGAVLELSNSHHVSLALLSAGRSAANSGQGSRRCC